MGTPAQEAEGGQALDQVLPADTFAFVSLDAGSLENELGKLDIVQLLGEPEVRDFLAPLTRRMLGSQPDDLVAALMQHLPVEQFLSGRVEAGISGIIVEFTDIQGNVTSNRLSASEPLRSTLLHQAFGAISKFNGRPFMKARVMADFLVSIESGPALHQMATQRFSMLPRQIQQRTVQVAGHSVTELTTKLPNQASMSMYVYSSPERWLIAGDSKRIEAALAGGAQNNLASAPAYKASRARVLTGTPMAHVYINAATMLEAARPLVPPILFDELELLGLSGVQGISYGMSMVEGSVRDSFRLEVKPDGMFGVLRAMGGGLRSFDSAPANALAYGGVRFDVKKAYDANLDFAADVLLPGGKDQLHAIVAQIVEHNSPIGSIDDLLAALGDEIDVTVTSVQGFMPNLILTCDLGDEEKFAVLLQRIKSMAAAGTNGQVSFGELTLGELKGTTIAAAGAPFRPAMVIQDGKLHVALLGGFSLRTHLNDLQKQKDQQQQGDQQQNAAHDGIDAMARLRRTIPTDDLGLVAYLNLNKIMPIGYGTAMPMLTMQLSRTNSGLDPALLPMADTVSRHFSAMALAITRDDDGTTLHTFSPAGVLPIIGFGAGTATRRVRVAEAAEAVPQPAQDHRADHGHDGAHEHEDSSEHLKNN